MAEDIRGTKGPYLQQVADGVPPSWRTQNLKCDKTKSNGRPCGGYAIQGLTSCKAHIGMSMDAARAKAEAMAAGHSPEMIQILTGIARTGESENARITAAKDVLNRGGVTIQDRMGHSAEEEGISDDVKDAIDALIGKLSRTTEIAADMEELGDDKNPEDVINLL